MTIGEEDPYIKADDTYSFPNSLYSYFKVLERKKKRTYTKNVQVIDLCKYFVDRYIGILPKTNQILYFSTNRLPFAWCALPLSWLHQLKMKPLSDNSLDLMPPQALTTPVSSRNSLSSSSFLVKWPDRVFGWDSLLW